MRPGTGSLLQVTADGWLTVNQGNAGVGIEQVVHSNPTPERLRLLNLAGKVPRLTFQFPETFT
jgi:hypothetical protein